MGDEAQPEPASMSMPSGEPDQDHEPLVSVILPTYNRAGLLPRAIDSVMGQSMDDWELLIIDDGSTDDTVDVVRSYGDPRIRLEAHDHNMGGSAARNTGLRLARGRFVAFLDSDDEWLPGNLERQSAELEREPEIAAVVCGKEMIPPSGPPTIRVVAFSDDPYEDILAFEHGGFTTTVVMLRGSLTVEEGLLFDEELPAYEEWDLLLRLAKRHPIKAIPDQLVVQHYEDEIDRVSNPQGELRALTLIRAKYERELAGRPSVLARHHFKAARLCIKLGDTSCARHELFNCVRANPSDVKKWWLLVGSLGGRRSLALAYSVYVDASLRRRSGV